MLPSDLRFGSQDYWLAQSHRTLAYIRTLQYWAEEAQPLVLGWPHHLAENMANLWQAMDPLISFIEVEVFTAIVPSNWVEVSSPRPVEPTPQDPHCSHSHSHSRSHWACQRGSPSVAHWEDKPINTEETDAPAASSQEKMLLQSHYEPPCPLPRLQILPVPCGERSQWAVV